jgi:protein-S-isoprenylcysteine O-methyltransferase Ste14
VTQIDLVEPSDGSPGGAWSWRRLRGSGAYDRAVRAALAGWFTLVAALCAGDIAGALVAAQEGGFDALGLARLLSKSCVFLFVASVAALALMRARPIAQAEGWWPRLVAIAGCYLFYGFAFLPQRTDLPLAVHLLSAALIVCGYALAAIILLRLGRSFSIMAEARRLVTGGPYALVRHPLYLAEQIAILGAFLQYSSLPAALLVIVQLLFQIQRMRNEEAVLARSFPDYRDYARRTARLIPGLW